MHIAIKYLIVIRRSAILYEAKSNTCSIRTIMMYPTYILVDMLSMCQRSMPSIVHIPVYMPHHSIYPVCFSNISLMYSAGSMPEIESLELWHTIRDAYQICVRYTWKWNRVLLLLRALLLLLLMLLFLLILLLLTRDVIGCWCYCFYCCCWSCYSCLYMFVL